MLSKRGKSVRQILIAAQDCSAAVRISFRKGSISEKSEKISKSKNFWVSNIGPNLFMLVSERVLYPRAGTFFIEDVSTIAVII